MRLKVSLVGIVAAVVSALVYLVYAPVVHNGFITMDDDTVIFENDRVRQGLSPRTISWALTAAERSNWYPLTRLSHLADVSLFGMWAGGHHLVSVTWHVATAVLLLGALNLMTGMLWRSFVVAVLFAVHPLNVESVAWATERSMVLSGFFLALTLLLWARYARRPDCRRYLAVLVAFALGLTAKPVLVTLPFVLLLLDFWPLCRLTVAGLKRSILEKVPFMVLGALSGLITFAAQNHGGAVRSLEDLPFLVRLGHAPLSYWHYLSKILWPADLAIMYPHPGAQPWGRAVLASLLLAALTGLILALSRRKPWLGLGWLWFIGMLVPMIGLIQVGGQAHADRFTYLPAIGVFLALVWTAMEALSACADCGLLVGSGTAAVIFILGSSSRTYVGSWRDSKTLYVHTLAVTRDNALIENLLGNEFLREGRLDEAIARYRESVRSAPTYYKAHVNLGLALSQSGRTAEAEAQYREALGLQPDDADAHFHYGYFLWQLNRPVESEAELRQAVRLRPNFANAHYNLGVLLTQFGRREEAEDHFRTAARLRGER